MFVLGNIGWLGRTEELHPSTIELLARYTYVLPSAVSVSMSQARN